MRAGHVATKGCCRWLLGCHQARYSLVGGSQQFENKRDLRVEQTPGIHDHLAIGTLRCLGGSVSLCCACLYLWFPAENCLLKRAQEEAGFAGTSVLLLLKQLSFQGSVNLHCS